MFLKLGDDRGWVFERHPKTGIPLVTRAEGEYNSEPFRCTYKAEQVGSICYCSCATVTNLINIIDYRTGHIFRPEF